MRKIALRKTGVEPGTRDKYFAAANFSPRIGDMVRYSEAAKRNKVGKFDDDIHQIVGFGHNVYGGHVELENRDTLSHAWLILEGGTAELYAEVMRLRQELDELKSRGSKKKKEEKKVK